MSNPLIYKRSFSLTHMSNVISFPEVSTVANDSRVPNTGFDLERKLRSVTRLTDLLGAGYQHLFQGGTEPVSDIAELKMQAVRLVNS